MNLLLFARALVKWLPGACEDSWEIINTKLWQENITPVRAIYSLLIGSLTVLWDNIACVQHSQAKKQHLDSWGCTKPWTLPFSPTSLTYSCLSTGGAGEAALLLACKVTKLWPWSMLQLIHQWRKFGSSWIYHLCAPQVHHLPLVWCAVQS